MQRVRRAEPLSARHLPWQEILKAGVIPAEQVLANDAYAGDARPRPAGRMHSHVAGIDLVRTADDQFYVLEDNLRTPWACPTCSRTAR